MYQPKTFSFTIPLRAKAVQSARFTGTHSYVDPKVRKWKAAVSPYITVCKPDVPSPYPFEVVKAVYTFAFPKAMSKKAKKAVEEAIARGEDIPYTSTPDLSDNANKGLADLLTACGIWEDDRRLWRVAPGAEIKKVYGDSDKIEITVRETPFVMTPSGRTFYDDYQRTLSKELVPESN